MLFRRTNSRKEVAHKKKLLDKAKHLRVKHNCLYRNDRLIEADY